MRSEFPTSWSKCSRTCGSGVQNRNISEDVIEERKCNKQPCPRPSEYLFPYD